MLPKFNTAYGALSPNNFNDCRQRQWSTYLHTLWCTNICAICCVCTLAKLQLMAALFLLCSASIFLSVAVCLLNMRIMSAGHIDFCARPWLSIHLRPLAADSGAIKSLPLINIEMWQMLGLDSVLLLCVRSQRRWCDCVGVYVRL